MREDADPGDSDGRRRRMDLGKHGRDVLALGPVHLADEAQRQVQLLVILPPGMGNTVHGVREQIANGGRRAECYEEAEHDKLFLLQ